MLIFMMITILTILTIIIITTDHFITTVPGLLIATGTIIITPSANAVRSTEIQKDFQPYIQNHVCLTWAYTMQIIQIQLRPLLQKARDMVAILLPILPIIQAAAQAQIQEAAATTIAEVDRMRELSSGRHFPIPVTTAATVVQANHPAPTVPQVQVVQVPEAAVEAPTHRLENSNLKSIQTIHPMNPHWWYAPHGMFLLY